VYGSVGPEEAQSPSSGQHIRERLRLFMTTKAAPLSIGTTDGTSAPNSAGQGSTFAAVGSHVVSGNAFDLINGASLGFN